jgi:hypothetical protein
LRLRLRLDLRQHPEDATETHAHPGTNAQHRRMDLIIVFNSAYWAIAHH